MSACSWASCGNCGRCTSRSDGTSWEPDPVVTCKACGQIIERVSIAVPIDNYNTVVACSDICAQNIEANVAVRRRA